jgi:hypothetical protein
MPKQDDATPDTPAKRQNELHGIDYPLAELPSFPDMTGSRKREKDRFDNPINDGPDVSGSLHDSRETL